MSLRSFALILTLLAMPALADPPSGATPGATKPVAEQNVDANGYIMVHEQGVAKVDVQNSNLNVAVTNTPTVNVASMPNVTIDSLPSVTIDNSSLDVRVTNAALPVSGTVAISNFPPAPPSSPLPTVTRLHDIGIVIPAGEERTLTFPTLNTVSFELTSYGNSYLATMSGPLGTVFFVSSDDTDHETSPYLRTFTYPVPLNSVLLYCNNSVDDCLFDGTILGF